MDVVIAAAALGAGLMAGVFFTFSGFVMAGLDRLPPAQAADAMRGINVTAVRPPLMLALFGTAALCVAAAVSGEPLAIAGAATYLAGAVVVTMAANVPLNTALDRDAVEWSAYLRPWTAWNSLRGVASFAASALFVACA